MSKGYFITGTDTGVGKTVVTALLASILRRQGLHVGVMKPAETGCPRDGDQLIPQDSLFLRQISGGIRSSRIGDSLCLCRTIGTRYRCRTSKGHDQNEAYS